MANIIYEGKYLLKFIKLLFLRYFEFQKLFVGLVIELEISRHTNTLELFFYMFIKGFLFFRIRFIIFNSAIIMKIFIFKSKLNTMVLL